MVQLGEQQGQEAGVLRGDGGRHLSEREGKRVAQRHLALALRHQAGGELQPRVRPRCRRQAAQEARQRSRLGSHLAKAEQQSRFTMQDQRRASKHARS